MMESSQSSLSPLPSLPILQPELPKLYHASDVWDALISYFGIYGLLVLVTLTEWLGYRMWSIRDIWALVHVLHDPRCALRKMEMQPCSQGVPLGSVVLLRRSEKHWPAGSAPIIWLQVQSSRAGCVGQAQELKPDQV